MTQHLMILILYTSFITAGTLHERRHLAIKQENRPELRKSQRKSGVLNKCLEQLCWNSSATNWKRTPLEGPLILPVLPVAPGMLCEWFKSGSLAYLLDTVLQSTKSTLSPTIHCMLVFDRAGFIYLGRIKKI